jgi:TorA maturation chaperone TorD
VVQLAVVTSELFRALGVLAEPPGPEAARLCDLLGLGAAPAPSEYTAIFLLELSPYASVYLGPEGMIGGDARARVGDFWRAIGQSPPGEPDHLAALLGLYATLADACESETGRAAAAAGAARVALLQEHILSWLPAWTVKVEEIAGGAYGEWARLLSRALESEAGSLVLHDRLPAHLREAPPLADPRIEGAEPFLSSLLAPVRSGMILARRDLARAARTVGVGLRPGARLAALRALLAEEAAATLAWLGDEAARWRAMHAGPDPRIAAFWRDRADATARLARELAVEPDQTA